MWIASTDSHLTKSCKNFFLEKWLLQDKKLRTGSHLRMFVQSRDNILFSVPLSSHVVTIFVSIQSILRLEEVEYVQVTEKLCVSCKTYISHET